jgi:hypothetical protein
MTDWRCSGVWSQYFETSTCATKPGPGRPRSISSDGIGACTMVSQDRLAALAWLGREGRTVRTNWLGRTGVGAGVLGGDVFFKAADQQFELFDVAIELFRRAAEAGASQRRQLHLQLFDVQCLGMDLCGIGGEFDLLARQFGLQVSGKKLQCLRVGRQRLMRQGHAEDLVIGNQKAILPNNDSHGC